MIPLDREGFFDDYPHLPEEIFDQMFTAKIVTCIKSMYDPGRIDYQISPPWAEGINGGDIVYEKEIMNRPCLLCSRPVKSKELVCLNCLKTL